MTIARELIEARADDPYGFVAEKIEEAEAYRDGRRITKWLMVREALRELRHSGPSDEDQAAEHPPTGPRSRGGRSPGH